MSNEQQPHATETHAVGAPVEQPVRPSLAEALESYWDAAHAEGAEGRTHDTEDRRADSALRDVMTAVAGLINAERAAERERIAQALEAETLREREACAYMFDGANVPPCRFAAIARKA